MRTRGRVSLIAIGLVLCTVGRGTPWAAEAVVPNAESTKEMVGRVEAQSKPVVSVPAVRNEDPFPASLAVLYDQTANVNANATSQNFEASYDIYDNQAADDFIVSAGSGWNVTTVFAPGAYSTTHGTPASMRVTFFADAAGVPGAPICDFPALAFTEAPVGAFTINIPGGCVLSTGKKWVSVVANLNFGGGGGQWFWSTRTVLTGSPSKWQNPGGGFNTGCSTWGTRTTCLSGQTDPDMAFRLEGGIASCTVNADCADGNLCNGVETCTAGSCLPGTPVDCSDGLQCTLDVCTPATGVCSNPPNPCSDGDSCTADSCSEAGGCQHTTPAPLRFCSAGGITIPSVGSGVPYPSSIAVSGLGLSASLCSVELLGIAHTFPDDIDILLAGPLGGASNAIIMSDVGGSVDITGVNLTLKDAAAASLPDSTILTTGTFKPTNIGGGDTWPAPAPAPAGGSALSVFNGTNPNGNWNLFLRDQFSGDAGAIANGWCVNIVVSSCSSDAECSDGNSCNGIETCVSGACTPGTATDCDDSLFCTIDSCNPANGQCVHNPNPCNDNNLCTSDVCDETNGCQNINRCEQFCASGPIAINDGTSTAPAPGTPYPSAIVVSGVGAPAQLASVEFLLTHTFPDDVDFLLVGPTATTQNAIIFSDAGGSDDVLNRYLILSDVGATGVPDGGPLVDGATYKPTNIGTGDIFAAPAPAPTAATTLSPMFDGNPNGSWSLYVVDDAAQDTGSVGAWCLNILPPGCTSDTQCDDGNPCTSDTCASGACFNANNTAPCEDGNACTSGDVCADGQCTSGGAVDPDDGNACTDDSCDPGTGVHNDPNTNPCDDGNVCTTGDTCGGGSCQPGSGTLSCDDGNPCTDDFCAGGCQHTNNTDPCDDGDPGTVNDTCDAGVCSGVTACTPGGRPKSKGYYWSLCQAPHSGDTLTAADAACVASLGGTFADVTSVADVCAALHTTGSDKCLKAEEDLMATALNICKQKVCEDQPIESACGSATSVGESYDAMDAALSNPSRTAATCDAADCAAREINNGKALEANSLQITSVAGEIRLDWEAPLLENPNALQGYKVYRRAVGSSAAFTQIGTTATPHFIDPTGTTGNFEYEIVAY